MPLGSHVAWLKIQLRTECPRKSIPKSLLFSCVLPRKLRPFTFIPQRLAAPDTQEFEILAALAEIGRQMRSGGQGVHVPEPLDLADLKRFPGATSR